MRHTQRVALLAPGTPLWWRAAAGTACSSLPVAWVCSTCGARISAGVLAPYVLTRAARAGAPRRSAGGRAEHAADVEPRRDGHLLLAAVARRVRGAHLPRPGLRAGPGAAAQHQGAAPACSEGCLAQGPTSSYVLRPCSAAWHLALERVRLRTIKARPRNVLGEVDTRLCALSRFRSR